MGNDLLDNCSACKRVSLLVVGIEALSELSPSPTSLRLANCPTFAAAPDLIVDLSLLTGPLSQGYFDWPSHSCDFENAKVLTEIPTSIITCSPTSTTLCPCRYRTVASSFFGFLHFIPGGVHIEASTALFEVPNGLACSEVLDGLHSFQ